MMFEARMFPRPEKLTIAQRVHYLDHSFEKGKAETLRKLLTDDEERELWYYQWDLDMQCPI